MKIGIDLGGSNIRIYFEDGKSESYSVFSQPGNPFVNSGIFEFFHAKLNGKKAEIIACAVSGGGSLKTRNEFKEKLSRFSNNVFIFSDVKAVYHSFFSRENGIIVVAGTGSVVYGKNNFKEKQIGGLGYLFGDEGGGFWFGKEFLRKGLFDMQTGKSSDFSQEVSRYFASQNYADILREIYSSHFPSKLVADFGATVLNSQSGRDILKIGAKKLAENIRIVSELLNLRMPKIGLYGGVFAHSPLFEKMLKENVSAFFEKCEFPEQAERVEKVVIKMAEEEIEKQKTH